MIARLLLVLLLGGAVLLARPAAAVDVSQLSDFENDPCVQALAQRNTDQHVDAPDSELSDNCDRARGNVEVAWDFLLRTWQPRTPVPVYAAPLPLDPANAALAALQVLLTYAVLGAPLRPLLRLSHERRAIRRETVASVAAMLLRFVAAAVFGALLLLPGLHVLASLALLAAIAAAVRRPPRRSMADHAAGGGVAALAATLVNDVVAAGPAVLALSLILRGFWAWLAPALLIGLLLAVPAVHRARVALRRQRWANAAAAALLAVEVARMGGADPWVMQAAGRNAALLRLVLAGAFAGVVLWRAGILRARLRHGSLPLDPAKG